MNWLILDYLLNLIILSGLIAFLTFIWILIDCIYTRHHVMCES